jgi:NDP-sugar pyrophosphorylase family protein
LANRSIERAVILAAGRGTRMGNITSEIPKPMLLVRGRPILEHILERLASTGVRQFLVVVGYRRELIEERFRDWRLPIEFRVQDSVDGTGSAARLAREFAGEAGVLLTFGDILCDPSAYAHCAAVLCESPKAAAVVGVKDLDDPWRGAAVYVEEGKVRAVVEKPPRGTSRTRWGSAGLYAFRPVVFQYLDRLQPSSRNEYELTSVFEKMLDDGLELRIAPMEGGWRDVGSPEDLEAANGDLLTSAGGGGHSDRFRPQPFDHPQQNPTADGKHGEQRQRMSGAAVKEAAHGKKS